MQQIEERVTILEAEITQLKRILGATYPPVKPWWEKIAGTFANDPIFDEAMALGAKYRKSLRSNPVKLRRNKGVHS